MIAGRASNWELNGHKEKIMATFILIGVYRIFPTANSISAAIRYHEYDWLLEEKGEYNQIISLENSKNLCLIEAKLVGQYSPSELIEVSQDDQAPYMEFYLDPTGTKLLTEEEAIRLHDRRICFFLHFTDPSRYLQVGDKKLTLTPVSKLPDRLMPYTHYIPVD